MSIEESVKNNLADIQKMQEQVVDALAGCQTGKAVLEKSGVLGSTDEMMRMMQIFADPDAMEVDRITMAKYFGKAMEGNVHVNMQKFVDYLDALIVNPQYSKRAEYYKKVRLGVDKLRATAAFSEYMAAYRLFQDDGGERAVFARGKIEEISNQMRKLIEGGQASQIDQR